MQSETTESSYGFRANRRALRRHTAILIIISGFLFGCSAGDGQGLDNNGVPIDATPTPDPAPNPNPAPEPDPTPEPMGLQPNLASIQEHVLTPICTECHSGANAPVGLGMDNLETSIANLIDVDSGINPLFKRVLPGESAEQSFLFLKIIGDPQAGARMPLGRTPLPEETIDVFRKWIEDGAPRDSEQLVVAQSTAVFEELSRTINVSLRFNQPIDQAAFNRNNIQFFSANDQAQWPVSNADLVYRWISPTQINISGLVMEEEAKGVIVRLNQSSTSSIYSESGNWLDGDRNGFAGGEFVHEYK